MSRKNISQIMLLIAVCWANVAFAADQPSLWQEKNYTMPATTKNDGGKTQSLHAVDERIIPIPSRLPTDEVIQSDIRYGIALGVRHLNSLFDRDKDNEPFFGSAFQGNKRGILVHGPVNVGIPHVPGRCILATMLAEEVTGIPFPEEGLKILERYYKMAFDNEDNINSYFDPACGNKRFIELHNLREGLLGLIALIKGRDSGWAREKADLMVARLAQFTSPEGHLSAELAQKVGIADRLVGLGCDASTSGRFVEALVEYYNLTGSQAALELAGLYAKGTLKSSFNKSGTFNPKATGHIHSLTSSLSGIVKYAVETQNTQMLAACKRIMDVGVPEYSSSWGWMLEGIRGDWFKGEINQTGDVIRTALVLAHAGSPEYFELAERWCRNMLLHAQHREEEMIRYMMDAPNPSGDYERDVLTRNIGGYGIKFPNDRMCERDWTISTLDITSGAVHALCECWRSRATIGNNVVRINLLFDYDDDDIELKSSLPLVGKLRFFKKSSKDLYVRIPEWVDPKTLRLEVQGKTVKNPAFEDGYLHIGALQKGNIGTVWFDVPCIVKHEKIANQDYTVTWWGNQVIDINPRGTVSPIPF